MSAIGRDGINYGIASTSDNCPKSPKCYGAKIGKVISIARPQKLFQSSIYADRRWIDRKGAIRWINSRPYAFLIREPLPLTTSAEEVKIIYEKPTLYNARKSQLISGKLFLKKLETDYKHMTLAKPQVSYSVIISALSPELSLDDLEGKQRDQYCVVNFTREARLEIDPAVIDGRLEKNKDAAETQENSLKDFAVLVSKKAGDEEKIAKQQALLDSEINPEESGEFSLFSSYHKERAGSYETSLDNAVGIASHVGERPYQEDRHIACDFEAAGLKIRLTGVFDGHGGSNMSDFISKELVSQFTLRLEEFLTVYPLKLAIYNTLKIVPFDLAMKFHESNPKNNSGATATFQLQIGEDLWTHNVGDSRTLYLYFDQSEGQVVVQKSEDMTLIKKYIKGVEKRGGEESEGMITGMIAIPRTIGDKPISAPGSARGKSVFEKNPKKGFTIHVCDGVTDVMTNEEIGQVIASRLRKGDSLAAAAKLLIEYAYARGSQDNLTCMIVDLK